jgi:biofilm PGA synthesis N-glycosyltransferase PgaC
MWDFFASALNVFTVGYPFVMAWYWMSGGILYRLVRERHEPLHDDPPRLASYLPVSILVPCHNEGTHVREVFAALDAVDYPDFEMIGINDGSSDDTGVILDELAARYDRLRVVHLATNRGKALALNAGAIAARHEILVAIDGDSLLDRDAVTWFVRRFQSDGALGALTGNPRIRNRSSLLARLQVGEYAAIVGLIKRAQTVFGCVYTVSGVVCAFRKRALHDAGWWSPATLTDDVDMTWRIQIAGWTVAYEPKALCWILMPETLRGLWRQRLRWSEGGTQTVLRVVPQMFHRRLWRLWIVWLNYVLSVVWAFATLTGILLWCLQWTSLAPPINYPAFNASPQGRGALLAVTYLFQASVGVLLDRRFEQDILRVIVWQAWYPIFFWGLQALTAVVGVPRAILRLTRNSAGTWVSPDRGVR